jgi:hypothetical protein
MEILQSIINDPAAMGAVAAAILTGVAIFLLRYVSRKTGVPTDDLQDQMGIIHEQAKAQVIERVARHAVRDPKTGKFAPAKEGKINKKKLPANKVQPDTPKTVPKDDEQSEEKEPAKRKRKNIKPLIIALMLLPLASCSLFDAGVKYATENIEITWKGDEAKSKQPIDSIVVKFEPVYWKENCEGYVAVEEETEVEFIKDGYRIWSLKTPNVKRYEVMKLDTVIYLYKK